MARSRGDDHQTETVRAELRREDEIVREEAGDPDRPDVPLGVPEDADPDERPGFPRDDPSHG